MCDLKINACKDSGFATVNSCFKILSVFFFYFLVSILLTLQIEFESL